MFILYVGRYFHSNFSFLLIGNCFLSLSIDFFKISGNCFVSRHQFVLVDSLSVSIMLFCCFYYKSCTHWWDIKDDQLLLTHLCPNSCISILILFQTHMYWPNALVLVYNWFCRLETQIYFLSWFFSYLIQKIHFSHDYQNYQVFLCNIVLKQYWIDLSFHFYLNLHIFCSSKQWIVFSTNSKSKLSSKRKSQRKR